MDVQIKIDKNYKVPMVVIYTNEITDSISELAKKLSIENSKTLTGFKNGEIFLLSPDEILNIYSEGQKIFAHLANDTLQLKYRLYELEDILDRTSFLRISNSEIVNFKKVKSLDMSISGTISLKFQTGYKSYVSRRYVEKIKNYLGL